MAVAPKRHEIEVAPDDIKAIAALIDERQFAAAGTALSRYLRDNNKDSEAWFQQARLFMEMENPAAAWIAWSYLIATPEGRDRWDAWCNLGRTYDQMHQWDKAETCHRNAVAMSEGAKLALAGLGTCLVQQYRSDEAIEVLSECIERYPDAEMARNSLGYAYLQKREWGKGWDGYEHGYGRLSSRTERSYAKEGRWQGEVGDNVRLIIHGEQGIGDQIAGLEPLLDVSRRCKVEALEISPKLATLVQRSFPDIPVYGTLHQTGLVWPTQYRPTAHTGLFQLHRHFRRREEDYPGTPFLTACPTRRKGYRAILDALGPEPKIGIAWTGGTAATQKAHRDTSLEELTPILRQRAHFISLEYRDRSEQTKAYEAARGIEVHNLHWASEAADYDETAALVAELDLVITVPTSAVHLAGALGVPTLCMVHQTPNIHYTAVGDTLAYYGDSVKLIRRNTDNWGEAIKRVSQYLSEWIDERNAA